MRSVVEFPVNVLPFFVIENSAHVLASAHALGSFELHFVMTVVLR